MTITDHGRYAVPTPEWDARTYASLALPHRRWGAGVIDRLGLRGDERVLDVGCGPGRDTLRLLELLPHGHVTAVDASEPMLEELRRQLASRPEAADRVTVLHADLREPLPIEDPADLAMSVATLHWVPDHRAVFRHVARVLRPGGWLVAECGGKGNITGVRAALWRTEPIHTGEVWNFAGVAETEQALESAGFTDVQVELVPDPAVLERGEQLETYLATVVLGAHLRELDPCEHASFVRSVAAELPEPVIDYVRLRIAATRR
ncbi:MAG TPA: class I SAM-dependent methyltransferase [Segeticoccus sp.]|nr:class I SAM-dependent methyltransferase [Segeticoccus sp.]